MSSSNFLISTGESYQGSDQKLSSEKVTFSKERKLKK